MVMSVSMTFHQPFYDVVSNDIVRMLQEHSYDFVYLLVDYYSTIYTKSLCSSVTGIGLYKED